MGRIVSKENLIAVYSFKTIAGGNYGSVYIEIKTTSWTQFESVIMKIRCIQSIELATDLYEIGCQREPVRKCTVTD